MAGSAAHRDPAKEQFWREQIAGQRGSGQTIRAYCRRHRLRESAFYFWRRELSRRGPLPAAAFMAVQITPDPSAATDEPGEDASAGRIEIVLTDGRRVRLTGPVDRRALADVLAILRFDALTAPSNVEGEGRAC